MRAYAEEHGMPESEALAAGMREKTEEFAHRGGSIYLPLTEE